MADDKYRLITRSDFDGLVSAMLLKELDLIDSVKFVHPKDVQDGVIEITGTDITSNLPYAQDAHYAFDHHASEMKRVGLKSNYMLNPTAPSAARVVWDSFGGAAGFPNIPEEIMKAVDKADSANYTKEEILNPTGWTLLSFIMDARTGLGRFHDFGISNYQLMMDLIKYCRYNTVDEILQIPDVKERVDLYFANQENFINQLKNVTTFNKNLAIINLLNEEVIYPGNRFMIYALCPDINVSMHVMWRVGGQKVVYAVGKSIFNRTNKVNIGALMLKYGGGGHKAAGTCQVDLDKSSDVKKSIISVLTAAEYNAPVDKEEETQNA